MLALFWEIGAGRVKYAPPQKDPESLENSGLLYPQCSRITPGISAYIPAVSSALAAWEPGAVAPPPVREKGRPQTGQGRVSGRLGIQRGLQHWVQRQDGLPEVSAIGPVQHFPSI